MPAWISAEANAGSDGLRHPQPETLYHYVVARGDLPLGHLVAQVVHAAGESSPGSLPPGVHAVALEAPDEPALLALHARLERDGIPHVLVREPDPPYHGAATALGIAPMPRARLRRHLSKFKLIGGRT